MSDYRDTRGVNPIIATHGLPHICSFCGDPAQASVSGSEITMRTPLPRVYPAAWVSTHGAWSLVKFQTESVGRIVAEVFCEPYVTLSGTP